MAVQFGTIKIKQGNKKTEIRCDARGEILDYWIYRSLLINKRDLNDLQDEYHGKFGLDNMIHLWNKLRREFIELEETENSPF